MFHSLLFINHIAIVVFFINFNTYRNLGPRISINYQLRNSGLYLFANAAVFVFFTKGCE